VPPSLGAVLVLAHTEFTPWLRTHRGKSASSLQETAQAFFTEGSAQPQRAARRNSPPPWPRLHSVAQAVVQMPHQHSSPPVHSAVDVQVANQFVLLPPPSWTFPRKRSL